MIRSSKVFWCFVIFCVGIMFGFDGVAFATPQMLPTGTVVSAKLVKPGIAAVSINGPITVVRFERYTSSGMVVSLGPRTTFDLNLQNGQRFNFMFSDKTGKIYYALITPEMAARPPSFFGPGVGLDCSSSAGCCFIVTLKQ